MATEAQDRGDYTAMLHQLQPAQAVDILNYRVQQVGKLNTQIADWLQERRQLEEQYSSGLRKLARRQFDSGDLGVFSVPWTTITGSADTLAESHSALASKIEADVERPLREFATNNREMMQVGQAQGNVAAVAREVERAQEKTDKMRGKGDKADDTKVASAMADLESAQTQWDSQAPPVFQDLQALDETRLNHLRDALTQLQTHELDQVERGRVSAEQCLNVLLNVETADEIKTFAIKAVQAKPSLARPNKRSSVAMPTPTRSMQPPPSASSSMLTPTLSPPDEDGGSSIQTDRQKGPLKGLRRLGTVMSRKRESKMPSTLPPTSESPERKQRPSPFSSISRFGRSRDNTDTLGSLQDSSPSQRPSGPPRLGSDLLESSENPADPPSPTPDLGPPRVNGTSASAVTNPAPTLDIPNGGHQGDLADLQPPQASQPEPSMHQSVTETQKDSEGFSVPPQDLDPISQAQQDAALQSGAPQYNVNIRDAPIQEDSGGTDAALATLSNKLQAPPTTTTRRAGTVRGRRDNRNSAVPSNAYLPAEQSISESSPEGSMSASREAPVPTTIPEASPPIQPTEPALVQSPSHISMPPSQAAAPAFSAFSSQSEQQVPSPFRPDSRAAGGVDATRTDSQSIRSSTTTGSQAGARHPELHETGLNSSIIENVSARFDNGKLTSSSIIGEIALAYNPANFSSPFSNEDIRLENFSSLEKVAPNPAFVNPSSEKEGEYSINLAGIGKTQIAFKYQVRVDEEKSHAPLLVTPAFKPEANQFSVIINYSLNPSFDLQGRDSITLSNVMLGLTLEGAKATSCLSKPAGTFSREKNLVFWQLNSVTLTPGAAPTKLLARFATESQASSGSVEAKWEITGEQVQGLGSGLEVSMPGQSGAGTGADPFADEDGGNAGAWKAVPGARKLASGNYIAK